ncbi:hypothetical protein B0H10DRAFT_2212336 [Mycena sp. CBHHK59/15]|nr:hypothetical protein B0H10DRAFT_2212336 [Mycena sp. CBHHK59/15]
MPETFSDTCKKYAEEREKRVRAEGTTQFVELHKSPEYAYMQEDPWADHVALNAQSPPLKDGDAVKFLVLGVGFGGLLFAVRLIQAGFSAGDVRLVDVVGGFGRTWYWSRYPGLMCDTENCIYMPLLEETGYMPKQKYSYGPELREHANRIAKKWDLVDKALFRTEVKNLEWDHVGKQWAASMTQYRGPREEKKELAVRAQFVIATSRGPRE